MLSINEIKGLSPKAKAEIFNVLQEDPEVVDYFINESDSEWLLKELEKREDAFRNGSMIATTREDLNKRLAEKWNEEKAD